MRVAGAAVLLVAGAGTALATTALHQHWWGLLLGAVATLATLVAAGSWLADPLPVRARLGRLRRVGRPRRGREGDYAISSDGQGYALLMLAFVVLVYALVTLPRPGRRSPA